MKLLAQRHVLLRHMRELAKRNVHGAIVALMEYNQLEEFDHRV